MGTFPGDSDEDESFPYDGFEEAYEPPDDPDDDVTIVP